MIPIQRQASFLDSVRDWDLSLIDIWHWFRDLVMYYVDVIGWPAYLIAGGAILLVLLSNELTNKITSLVVARAINYIGILVFGAIGLVLWGLGSWTKSQMIARWRDAMRFRKTAFDKRRRDIEEDLAIDDS